MLLDGARTSEKQRTERTPEILTQIDNQKAFWAAVLPMRQGSKSATQQVIDSLTQMCVFVEMQVKNYFGVPRPNEYSPQVQSIITTPGHGSYPMGHACQAYATARILQILTGCGDPTQTQLFALAKRISDNRIFAGVHYPIDLDAGAALGVAIADWFAAVSGAVVTPKEIKFDPTSRSVFTPPTVVAAAWGESPSCPIAASFWVSAQLEWKPIQQRLPVWLSSRFVVDQLGASLSTGKAQNVGVKKRQTKKGKAKQ